MGEVLIWTSFAKISLEEIHSEQVLCDQYVSLLIVCGWPVLEGVLKKKGRGFILPCEGR